MIKWFTIILAVLGLSLGLWTVATSKEVVPKPPPAEPPSINPYPHGIAASGLVEARSRNVQVQSPEAGLVTRVLVEFNQAVHTGDPLFELDARLIDAEIVRAEAALALAKVELERLRQQPRSEDVSPLVAAVGVAKAQSDDAKDQLERTQDMVKRNAGTENELARKQYAVEERKAALTQAQAELDRVKAGAWKEDIAVAVQRVAQAQSDVQALHLRRDRLTVRSPIDGSVLKRFIEPGEFANTNATNPAMVLGDLSRLNVRAQVDEEDAPMLRPGAKGTVRLRGAVNRVLSMKMLRIEPWAQPKVQITGQNLERVDTRVIDVIFEVEGDDLSGMFPGQIVDVFIDAEHSGAGK
ncbi:MAG: efflux RND transporter periplasmic adaptor subunit [Planctomycetes bacterium]|nr:efflux RND transporter periplasmic adaptor subunit [Planctomycetota bacterium]